MPENQTAEIGQYRPAARLKEGWHLWRTNGTWQEITSLVQIVGPVGIAMVTLADGFEVNIPHTHEVKVRNQSEIAAAKGGVSE